MTTATKTIRVYSRQCAQAGQEFPADREDSEDCVSFSGTPEDLLAYADELEAGNPDQWSSRVANLLRETVENDY